MEHSTYIYIYIYSIDRQCKALLILNFFLACCLFLSFVYCRLQVMQNMAVSAATNAANSAAIGSSAAASAAGAAGAAGAVAAGATVSSVMGAVSYWHSLSCCMFLVCPCPNRGDESQTISFFPFLIILLGCCYWSCRSHCRRLGGSHC